MDGGLRDRFLVDFGRVTPVDVAIFLALFGVFECSIAESAEFAYVRDFAFFLKFVYHCDAPKESRPFAEDRLYIEISSLKHSS